MRNHKFFWGSSYDRGLDTLLNWWPDIIKKHPDAELHICYGWELFDKFAANNPERQEWKARVVEMMKQPGITHHGRVGKEKLSEIRKSCGIWAYPTWFAEINCITALEAQRDGLVPVCSDIGALPEVVKEGFVIKNSEGMKPEVAAEFKAKIYELMSDEQLWDQKSKACQKFARVYSWKQTAKQWIEEFKSAQYDVKVTVFTPTIRDGFWNVMAHNLAAQKHKNFEWIIVDGQDVSREDIAAKYAKKYNIDIRYFHQGKTKRTYGLCNANNIAIREAKGDIFVFLQDFVLMSKTGLYELVRESERHPGDFIAPVDSYFKPKKSPNLNNKEDWFDGDLDVVGDFLRANVRIQNKGLRLADQMTDFEQNYGAVPTSTLRLLGGYYEFFDEALGWDNTEIIYRAQKCGFSVWIDEHNIGICLDHHTILGNNEGGTSVNRSRRLNDPRMQWMIRQIEKGKLPLKRRQEIDDKIDLQYEIPAVIPDDKVVEYVHKMHDVIINEWPDL